MKTISHTLHRTTRARWVHALVLTRVFVGALLLGGCVARPAYEEVSSAAEVEKEGRRRASLEGQTIRAELSRLSAERDRLSEQLRRQEELAATAQLDLAAREAEKEQQELLVGQLQSELGRVAEHLKIYADERDRLGEEKAKLLGELARAKDEVGEGEALDATDEAPAVTATDEAPAATDEAPAEASSTETDEPSQPGA